MAGADGAKPKMKRKVSRRPRGKVESPKTPRINDLFLIPEPEQDQKEQKRPEHPLDLWTREQVAEWADNDLREQLHTKLKPKSAQAVVSKIQFTGRQLNELTRQWFITEGVKGKDIVLDAVEKLRQKLQDAAIKQRNAVDREKMLQDEKGIRPGDLADFDDDDDELIAHREREREAKRAQWMKELRMPKSQRAWQWQDSIKDTLELRKQESERTKFRLMRKMSNFERERVDGQKYIKRLQRRSEFNKLHLSEQIRRKKAKFAMSGYLNHYSAVIERDIANEHHVKGLCWKPVYSPGVDVPRGDVSIRRSELVHLPREGPLRPTIKGIYKGRVREVTSVKDGGRTLTLQRKMNGYSYIRDRWKQKRRAQQRSKSHGPCVPTLSLRNFKQRLPQDDGWKVEHLKRTLGKNRVSELEIYKALVDNKGFLSAALQALLRGSRLSGEDRKKIEEYKDFFNAHIRLCRQPKRLREEEIEDLITNMEIKEYRQLILKDGQANKHLHIVLEGRCMCYKIFRPRGGMERQIFLRQYVNGMAFGMKPANTVDVQAIGPITVGLIPMEVVHKYVSKAYIEQLIYQEDKDIIARMKAYERDNNVKLLGIMPELKQLKTAAGVKMSPLKRSESHADEFQRLSLARRPTDGDGGLGF